MAKHWMAQAFANAHGQFAAKAKKVGMSTAAYAEKKDTGSGKTAAQARLALIGMRANHRRMHKALTG